MAEFTPSPTGSGESVDRLVADVRPGVAETTYGYDPHSLGRQTRMVDPTGETTYSWDRAGGLAEVVTPSDTVGFGYDLHGHRTSVAYPWGLEAVYVLDDLGRPVVLTEAGVERAGWDYDHGGRLVSQTLDGLADTYSVGG